MNYLKAKNNYFYNVGVARKFYVKTNFSSTLFHGVFIISNTIAGKVTGVIQDDTRKFLMVGLNE